MKNMKRFIKLFVGHDMAALEVEIATYCTIERCLPCTVSTAQMADGNIVITTILERNEVPENAP